MEKALPMLTTVLTDLSEADSMRMRSADRFVGASPVAEGVDTPIIFPYTLVSLSLRFSLSDPLLQARFQAVNFPFSGGSVKKDLHLKDGSFLSQVADADLDPYLGVFYAGFGSCH